MNLKTAMQTRTYFLIFLIFFSSLNLILPYEEREGKISAHINDNIETNFLTTQKYDYKQLYSNFSKIDRRRILFDMTHGQFFSIWDTGFMGYSELTVLLQKYFLEVSEITHSFIDTVKNLTSNDILFLNFNLHGGFTEQEVSNITEFVKRGGNLIIIGEHSGFNVAAYQNTLLDQFDMHLTELDIEDEKNSIPDNRYWNIVNSSFFNLNNICIWFGAALNLSGNAFAIANTSYTANYPNVPIAGGYIYNNFNKGKVVCVADSEWLWNANRSYGGIHYGNNSAFLLNILDWFYKTNLSIDVQNGLEIIPEYNLFTSSHNSNFSLNMTMNMVYNVSADIIGGDIFPVSGTNLIGHTSWEINISTNGYVKFTFTKPKINATFSKVIYFFEGEDEKSILFVQHNSSRQIDNSVDGLLKLAFEFRNKNYSVYGINKLVNYSEFNLVIISNPLQKYSREMINKLNNSHSDKTKILFLNAAHSSLNSNQDMPKSLRTGVGDNEAINFTALDVPINNVSSIFGINFSHHILFDFKYNFENKSYYPKLIGVNGTIYNISCYMSSILNYSTDFQCELKGYNNSWGEDDSILGIIYPTLDSYDINNTCVLAYSNTTLGAGILNYFTNAYFKNSSFFNDFFFNWIKTGFFCTSFKIKSNQSIFNFEGIHFNIISVNAIRDSQGKLIPNGTLLTVYFNVGTIVAPSDASLSEPGYQVLIADNMINFTLSSQGYLGLVTLIILEVKNYFVISSISLNFSSKPILYPISSNPSPKGDLSFQWKQHPQAKTYYIFRDHHFIINISDLYPIDNVSVLNYNESLSEFGTYYYVIVASNYKYNTSISNCISITIKPVLNPIIPSINANGEVILSWSPLIGAKAYYIYRSENFINALGTNVVLLNRVAETTYTDANLIQGIRLYYIIIGTDYSINSSISNCESVLVEIIPDAPSFSKTSFTFIYRKIILTWNEVKYALGYNVYLSEDRIFQIGDNNLLGYFSENEIDLNDLDKGTYYVKIISIGIYGNSTPSEVIKIIIIQEETIDENPRLIVLFIISIISITAILFTLVYLLNFKSKIKIKERKSNF
ncbi:MAG: hypothetical protein ACTSR8_16710 [Promethearchaeota archaeon]